MTDPAHAESDLALFALDLLDAQERAVLERHLADCPSCREEVAKLQGTARVLALAPPLVEPPPSLAARTLFAVEREAELTGAKSTSPSARPARRRLGRLRPALGVAAALVVAVGAILITADGGEEGDVEIDTALTAPGRTAAVGTVVVTNTGIGRVVALETTALPELDNTREFYEVWFVGPDDAPEDPNRVSAGTFHPDTNGRSSVRLAAAAVPDNYPVLAITREPRDGDPRAGGPEVLRARR